ncbi:D-alanyl-D-alanine carboxypeptidase [Sinirhodobacter populi]|uniref:D-alanyl-D-alanine carboxypeptidase n=1 Tax=Paenirhodobacter populi TaxID=2306993 RepID=A0A443KL29_9RHOB|nr:D-alanyl-D-alanine carboxypeptidase family protein [Sinirhodobacter populi]RWR33440.1 D-alanyl-D-alanine carboxypeptidase [Sinirhodobacter populi]
MRADTVTTLTRWVRHGLLAVFLTVLPVAVFAAPFAAMVMDARTGEVLYSKNADTRLHPASLTKMMTLYLAFQAVESGKVSLDSVVTVSQNAASQPPSRLGLRAGQKIQLRYLIRAAAVKSANDAAAAIGDYLGGNEANFATMMNRQAKALGMNSTTFRNANGLTRQGHLSTARDMSILGRHVIYDYPQYYNIFSRRTADAGIAKVASTNRRFLDAYDGADGIKTGYTVAAGFNLVGSAQRGNKRVIATVFGGTSTAQRNAKVAELLDIGFARAPNRANSPQPVLMAKASSDLAGPEVTGAVDTGDEGEAPGTMQVAANTANKVAPASSLRPMKRPGTAAAPEALIADAAPHHDPEAESLAVQLAANAVSTPAPTGPRPLPRSPQIQQAGTAPGTVEPSAIEGAIAFAQSTAPQPETLALGDEPQFDPDMVAEGDADPKDPVFIQTSTPQPETLQLAEQKAPRNDTVILAAMSPPAPAKQQTREVIARASTSGGRNWGINVGKFNTQYAAERMLLKTALMESDALGSALRKVAKTKTAFEANFVGMTKAGAELACARLTARATDCNVIGP